MFRLLVVSIFSLFLVVLTGCSSVHNLQNAQQNHIFYGDKALSLGGNLELLAGNSEVEDKNDDEALNKRDVHFIKLGGNKQSLEAVQNLGIGKALDLLSTAKLAGNFFALTSLFENPADYPDNQHIVLLRIKQDENPNTPEKLQQAFNALTNPESEKIKGTICAMDDDVLHCKVKDKNSNIGDMHFATLVDYGFVKRLNPQAEEGSYAAYGFEDATWTTSKLNQDDLRFGTENNIHFSATKAWYSLSNQGKWNTMFTYRVDNLESTSPLTVIYQYGAKAPDDTIAVLR